MSRQPYNILVIPYIRTENAAKYCILKRKDMDIWQFVAGGGEGSECPEEAALRECFEETGIQARIYRKLETSGHVPAIYFSEEAQSIWGPTVIVIPVYCFAVETNRPDIRISGEHIEYRWLDYDSASSLLHFDLDKTALYEIHESIRRNIL